MKIAFIGPSLAGAATDLDGLIVRPPARQGDIFRAVRDGASAIGLVDGVFGFVPSVWHKEILYALSEGVAVLGAASMGALRAAECAAFGMTPVGLIAECYLNGARTADADVCLAHAPAELGHLPLSEPMVDVEPTLAAILASGAIGTDEHSVLAARARRLHFAERTVDELLMALPEARRPDVARAYERHRVRQKRQDALELVAALRALPDCRGARPDWQLAPSRTWAHFLSRMQ